MPSSEAEPINTQTEDKMRKVATGTKIKTPTQFGLEYGIIVEHQPSPYSKDVYLIEWLDGSQTLFELKKENLILEKRKCPNKQKRN
jgi:hypothetical protein